MEQGTLAYGESAKGGYYLTTVNSANVDQKVSQDSSKSVVVSVSVKNVRGELLDLSELKFNLRDKKGAKSYEGKVVPDTTPFDMQVKPIESKY